MCCSSGARRERFGGVGRPERNASTKVNALERAKEDEPGGGRVEPMDDVRRPAAQVVDDAIQERTLRSAGHRIVSLLLILLIYHQSFEAIILRLLL